jgi:hypothetical protein
MLTKDRLLAIIKTRFDYYAAQAVFNDITTSLGLKGVDPLDEGQVVAVKDFLAENVPGSGGLTEKLTALLDAEEAPAAPAKEPPAEEPPAEEPPAEATPEKKPAKKAEKKPAKKAKKK